MTENLPTYFEGMVFLDQELVRRGNLGFLVINASSLAPIADRYGREIYRQARQRLIGLLVNSQGKEFRAQDVLMMDEPQGLRFLLFLDGKRRSEGPVSPADVRVVADRITHRLLPTLARSGVPYLQAAPDFVLGQAMAVHNPLQESSRIIARAISRALDDAALLRGVEAIQLRERITSLILQRALATAYQPIVSLPDRSIHGYEALSRGEKGSGLESADALFRAATSAELLVELDRACRMNALLNSQRVPEQARLFVNTLPATIRDPHFRAKPLIDFLERARINPQRIVIEITEHLVIENYHLFQEAMSYFTDLGMSFAVDDVGTGYSGLESIARLTPAYLKIDMELIRDIHLSMVNKEMVRAIVSLGKGIGAKVIAEGIQTEEELLTVQTLGADYGQGFFLGRPIPAQI